jgi:hypothetical protein
MINLLRSIYIHQVSPFDIVVRAVGDATPLHFMFFFGFHCLNMNFISNYGINLYLKMLQLVTFFKPTFFSLQINETVVPSCDEALFPASFNFLGNNV